MYTWKKVFLQFWKNYQSIFRAWISSWLSIISKIELMTIFLCYYSLDFTYVLTMLIGVRYMDRCSNQFWVNPVKMERVVGVVGVGMVSWWRRDTT